MADLFADISCGQRVLIDRAPCYGGPYTMLVTEVTAKRFTALKDQGGDYWKSTFRKSDGRIVGSRRHTIFAKRTADAEGKTA